MPKFQHSQVSSIADRVAELVANGRGPALEAARRRLAEYLLDGSRPTLKHLRLAAGLSQTDLAKKIGISQPRIARLEAGREKPGLRTLRKLAVALDIDINTIAEVFHSERG